MQRVIKINDNITLNYIPMSKLKTTSVSLYIHRRLDREEASENALLPHLLKRGGKTFKNSEEIEHYLENLYGAGFSAGISKRGNDHIICFDGESISDKYAPNGEKPVLGVLKLILSLVFDAPNEFDEDVFTRERRNSVVKIENIINDKRIYANYRCQEIMARGDVYEIPRLGYADKMKELTADKMRRYYENVITGSVIDIYVCGEADTDELEAEVRRATDGIKFKNAQIPTNNILSAREAAENVTEKMNVTQGKLSLGFTTSIKPSDKDYFALAVGNAIYGGGAQSKLFNNVREKMSLAYYVGSFIDKYKGYMMVNAGIEFKNFETAYKEILAQLDEMKEGHITDEELEVSKKYLINSLDSSYDSQHGLIAFHLNEKLAGTARSIEDYKKGVESVTVDEVRSAMQKIEINTVYFLTGKETE